MRTGVTPNNQENLTGRKGYNKWLRNIKAVAQEVGFKLMKFRKQDKDTIKQLSKDTTDTIKQQKSEEAPKSKSKDSSDGHGTIKESFSKDWWKNIFVEDYWDDMSPEQQDIYIKKHPKSKKALQSKRKEYKTEKGSQLVGVKHGQSTKEVMDGIKKDIKPNEKVTFVAEGGWIDDNGEVPRISR